GCWASATARSGCWAFGQDRGLSYAILRGTRHGATTTPITARPELRCRTGVAAGRVGGPDRPRWRSQPLSAGLHRPPPDGAHWPAGGALGSRRRAKDRRFRYGIPRDTLHAAFQTQILSGWSRPRGSVPERRTTSQEMPNERQPRSGKPAAFATA